MEQRAILQIRALVCLCLIGAMAMIGTIGCDKDETPAPIATNTPPPAPPAPPRPTTRDLLEGARTELPLQVAPLSIRVPPGWKLEALSTVMMVEGPSPSGNMEIVVSTLRGMSSQQIDMLVAGMKDDTARNPRRYVLHDLQTINGMPVLEQISYSGSTPIVPPSSPSLDIIPSTNPTEPVLETGAATQSVTIAPASTQPEPDATVSLTRTVFIPTSAAYLPCSFAISSMTQEQYAQDKDFLKSILDSAKPSTEANPANP